MSCEENVYGSIFYVRGNERQTSGIALASSTCLLILILRGNDQERSWSAVCSAFLHLAQLNASNVMQRNAEPRAMNSHKFISECVPGWIGRMKAIAVINQLTPSTWQLSWPQPVAELDEGGQRGNICSSWYLGVVEVVCVCAQYLCCVMFVMHVCVCEWLWDNGRVFMSIICHWKDVKWWTSTAHLCAYKLAVCIWRITHLLQDFGWASAIPSRTAAYFLTG